MTTIAYRDGVLAADSLVTCGGGADGFVSKARRIDGLLTAASGSTVHAERFFNWLAGGAPGDCPLVGLPENSRTNGLVVLPSGRLRVWCHEGSWDFTPLRGFYALGSGTDYAIGAMEMGADAERAVQVATIHDIATGGPITVLRP